MEKNAWLLRPNPHNISRIEEFMKKNIIAIGWPFIGNLAGKTIGQIKEILQGPPYSYERAKLGIYTSTIDIFVNKMQIGDLVLIPNNDDIYLAQIESDYEFDSSKDNNEEGYPHQRKILLLRKLLRTELPNNIRMSLKVQRTAADLTKHYEEIKLLSEGLNIQELSQELGIKKNDFVDIEYPIRPGVIVKISVPADMNQQEASRLGDFVKTIYFV